MTDRPTRRQPVVLLARPAAGGIRSHIIHLLEHLDRDRFDITLAAPHPLLTTLPDDLPQFTRHEIAITAKPSVYDPIAALNLARLARSSNAILHAQGIRAGFVAALARRISSFPLIVTHHNIPPASRLSHAALKLIGSQSDATICVSKAIADRIDAPNIHVIPNGIDLERFGHIAKAQARQDLHITSDAFVVACVSRLSPEKGVDLLLRAARLLRGASFLIAGSGPERDRLEADAPPNARFLGYVQSPAQVFAAADIAAIPSRTEGQGIVALEAMASGAAVIASNVGGLAGTIQHEMTGLLVDPESPIALASAIRRLQENGDFRERLATGGEKWVKETGDVAARVNQLEQVYVDQGRAS